MIYTILYLIKKDIILFITEAKANETFKQYLTQQPRLLKRAEYIIVTTNCYGKAIITVL